MNRSIALVIAALLLFGALAVAQPAPVGIYTFSRDSEAGFQDPLLDGFRREIGKYADTFMEIAYERDRAEITIQFLGQGELAVELDENGDAVRHLWTADDKAPRMWAVVRIGGTGGFAKEFSTRGSGGRDVSRLAKSIGEWLQANSTKIRERAR